ncbi:MAG TPA: N-6 DNA methylase [Actinomycetota bacterium]|nr:N-6 DNA methylase [Actinomycetota bacterium]
MTVARSKEEGRAAVDILTRTFASNVPYYKSSAYSETATRNQFIDPLFEALGWDVGDRQGLGPRRDVLVENRQQTETSAAGEEDWDVDLSEDEVAERTPTNLYPDYVFRVDLRNRLVAEAKKPSVDLQHRAPAFQAKSYAWTMRLPLAILTDFEELRVFDARYRPSFGQPNSGQVPGLDLRYDQYLDAWDRIWELLSRDAVVSGSLETFLAQNPTRGASAVDQAFLADLADWRVEIATDLKARNADLDRWEIAEATQRILDRVVFIRVMEDRGILNEPILRRHARLSDSYRRLVPTFRHLDAVYNGQLFANHFSERLDIADGVFQRLVESLYYPHSPYRFDVVAVDLLGSIYERFLGQEITIDQQGRVQIEDKPEVRHAGGVYYTPRWVVERIVQSALAPLVEGKTPRAVANIKIVDPACGSGAFLLGAFDYLVDWHERYYEAHPDENQQGHFTTTLGERRLTAETKANIIANNLFGVDIDAQAVEVTQMSLYLALLQNENLATLQAQLRLEVTAYLPKLDRNIRWGNSLLGGEDLPENVLFGSEELRRRVNPFDWRDEGGGFGAIFARRGGFDAVIGNPPYTRVQVLRRFRPEETSAYQAKYRSASEGSFDIASPFIERGLEMLRPDGRLGFIVSRQFCETQAGRPLRQLLSENRLVQEIVDFGSGLVFEGVSAYTVLLVAGRSPSRSWRLTRVPPPPSARGLAAAAAQGSQLTGMRPASILESSEWTLDLPAEAELLNRLALSHPTLAEVCGNVVFQGVVTGADYVYRLRDLGPHADPTLRRVSRRDTGLEGVIENELLRPVYGGRSDIRRFSAAEATEVLLLPYLRPRTGRPFVLMSPTEISSRVHGRSWLLHHEQELRARRGDWHDSNWWGYSRRQNLERFMDPKLLVPYMIDHLCAYLDPDDHFFVNVTTGGYGIPAGNLPDPAFVCALLNSRLLSWALRRYSRAFRGGWFAARKGNLVRLPIAEADDAHRSEVVDLYDRCVETLAAMSQARGETARDLAQRSYNEATRRFDSAVEHLYDLTPEEIQLLAVAG